MKTRSVLLVEDDRDDQEFFVNALSRIKNVALYDIANNGQEALDKLEKSVALPSLIIMDVNMPMMNGIECLSELIKKPRIKDIPVVFLSTDNRLAKLAKELGAKAFIDKPDNGEALREQLEKIIGAQFNNEIEGSMSQIST